MKWKEDQGDSDLVAPWLAAEKGNSNHDVDHAMLKSLIGRISTVGRLLLRPNRFSLPAPQTLLAINLSVVAANTSTTTRLTLMAFLLQSETTDNWLRQSFPCSRLASNKFFQSPDGAGTPARSFRPLLFQA